MERLTLPANTYFVPVQKKISSTSLVFLLVGWLGISKVGRLCDNSDETQIVKIPNVGVISAYVIKCWLKDQSFIMLLLNIYINVKLLS